jgi:hypothetical protein
MSHHAALKYAFAVAFVIGLDSIARLESLGDDVCQVRSERCPESSDCTPYDPEARSVLVKESSGRLGNQVSVETTRLVYVESHVKSLQMFSYATLLGLRMKFGYQTFMGYETSRVLGEYFDNLQLPTASEVLCHYSDVFDKYK